MGTKKVEGFEPRTLTKKEWEKVLKDARRMPSTRDMEREERKKQREKRTKEVEEGRNCVHCNSQLEAVWRTSVGVFGPVIGGPPPPQFVDHLVCPKCKLRYDL